MNDIDLQQNTWIRSYSITCDMLSANRSDTKRLSYGTTCRTIFKVQPPSALLTNVLKVRVARTETVNQ